MTEASNADMPISSTEIGSRELSAAALMPLVYQELKRIARRARVRVSGGETLATTALIHEAYLRLAGDQRFASHADFLRLAAVAMRGILVDRVRAQLTHKRGGDHVQVPLDEAHDFVVEDETTVLEVHELLEELSLVNTRLVEIVECRFFAGYSEPETAQALGVSERTVQRDWALARAWLKSHWRK